MFKVIGSVVGFILVILVVSFTLQYFSMLNTGFFQPKYEAIRRDTMIESRAYSEATVRNLNNLRLQYMSSTNEAEKATIRAIVLHETQAFDKNRLPADLKLFVTNLGG